MKTKDKILLILSGIYALVVMSVMNVNAQIFDPAIVSHTGYSASGNVLHTGNDIRIFSGDAYQVSVWDGDAPSLGWDINSSGTPGTVALGNGTVDDAEDPDVCLVTNGSEIFALVVYYSKGQGRYYLEKFIWNGSSFSNTGGLTVLQSSSCFGYTINIDSDDNNYFAVVWDKPSSCGPATPAWIYCITGSSPGGSPPTLDNSGSPVLINPYPTFSYRGIMPDVSISPDENSDEIVLLTYIHATGGNAGDMEVNYQLYTDLAAGNICTSSCNTYFDAPSTGDYRYPRIASSLYSGSELHWTVVIEENYSNLFWFITGITLYNYTSFPTGHKHTYNDGGTDSPGLIIEVQNLEPVVTYDNSSQYVFVGWTFDNYVFNGNAVYPYQIGGGPIVGNGAYNALYPIALLCDYRGNMVTNTHYWEVPYGVGYGDHYDGFLSISGRYATDNLYTFFGRSQSSFDDVWYKTVSQSASSLKLDMSNAEGTPILYPNPSKGTLTISGLAPGATVTVKNTLGEVVYRKSVSTPETEINLRSQPAGVYFITMTNSEKSITEKLLINR